MRRRGRMLTGAAVVALFAGVLLAAPSWTMPLRGRVIDAHTNAPIADAYVTIGETVGRTDRDGVFAIDGTGVVRARAVGYGRVDVGPVPDAAITVALPSLRPKALYASFYGIGSSHLRETMLALAERTEINALVIDVKGDQGKIPYASDVPLAVEVGAQTPRTIADVDALVTRLHARGLYLIARIVVFKDRPLAVARPALAVKTRNGGVWLDREHLPWTDPFRREVWDYNIDVAVEAARHGFDEIQFDYVRFPDATGLAYAEASTQESRTAAIGGFLVEARRRLVPYNVFLSADVFGYVCWNLNDTMIGQRIEDLAPLLDYVSPMLYPSSFQFGIPGYRNPVAHPYEIVFLSLEQARQRSGLPATRFRPWLQAFRDYAFDRRPFGGDEIRTEISAAEAFGSDGWMLWNPRNTYSVDGLAR
jgi:hypothetical protein